MKRLTYILPVFGVEKSISACLDSIYAQDLPEKDFEVICVDDCTQDKSCKIIESYQQIHDNLILIHHNMNKKAGGARNTGLRAASGRFIWFVDSDDTLVPCVAGGLLKKCEVENLDVLCFNIIIKDGYRSKQEIVYKEDIGVVDGTIFLHKIFGDQIIYHLGYPYRCLYNREQILKNFIRFPEGMLYGEDTTFMAEAICSAKRVACIPTCAYNYIQNSQSSSAQLFHDMRGDLIYQSTIQAGDMIVKLFRSIRNKSHKLSTNIEKGIPWFINRMFIRLIKTTHIERRNFYLNMHNINRIDSFTPPHWVFAYMDAKNLFIVKHPQCGMIVLDICAVLYKIWHRIK